VNRRLPREPNARLKVAICIASVVVVGAVAVYGLWQRPWAGVDPPVAAEPATVAVATPLPVAPNSSAVPQLALDNDALAASFDDFGSELGAEIGLAYASLAQPENVTLLGSWSGGAGWSTIKVPLALALLRETGGTVSPAMRSAITASDNAAAQSIWEKLGGGSVAAGKVQDVLAATGDPITVVPNELRRPGFSVFGQTEWSLVDQVRFLANVTCDAGAAPVTDLMGEIVSGQRWGLGTIDGALFKGGWGPEPDGLYLVRQYGVVPTKTGRVAVAIGAIVDSGGFSDGTEVLNRVARWLQAHLDGVGGGDCPPG
jgi:hypothetical protein